MPFFKKKIMQKDLSSMSMDELLFFADTTDSPQEIYAALLQAERLAPEDINVQRRLLMNGRLHERDAKKMDFSVIKCYLLHAFEHPEDHSEAQLKQMTRELFDEERLQTCLRLSKEPARFLQTYLEDLSREYMRVFVAPDNTHIPRVFGLSFKGSLSKYLAKPAKDIIHNILSSPYMNVEEARLLSRAFYRAFYDHAHGEVRELDSLLGAQLRQALQEEDA